MKDDLMYIFYSWEYSPRLYSSIFVKTDRKRKYKLYTQGYLTTAIWT